MRLYTTVTSIAFLMVAASSQATLLDFNSHADDFGDPMFEQGFTLDTAAAGWAIASDAFTFSPPVVQNGTTRFFMSGLGNGSATATVVLFDTTLTPFSLQGFDSATMFNDNRTNTVNLVGDINGGGTVTATFNINTAFQSFTLGSGWSNLDRVTFTSGTAAGFVTDPGVSLDNIMVNNPVPEPASLAILGLGVAFLRRRKK
jgi:PEP-CTERM motif